MPARSIFFVAAAWIGVIGVSFVNGLSASDGTKIGGHLIEMPVHVVVYLSVGTFIFFFLASFVQRSSTPSSGAMALVWLLDRIFRKHSVSPFERLMRVDLLFAAGAITHGLVGLITAYSAGLGPSNYFFGPFILSAGLGLLSAFAVSLKYPPSIW